MIPFWKKTDKGGKKKPQKPAVPRTAQQSIPMQRMFEDGTCRVKPNYYTRTIQYQDINYQLAQQEDKTAIFEEWCSFLNFFDSSIKFELSFVNMATDSTEFEKSIRIPYQRDGFDDVRAEYLPPYILQSKTDWRDSYCKIDRGGETVRSHVLCQSPRCHQPSGRLP